MVGYTQQAVTMRARAYHFVIEPDGSSVTTEDHDSDSPEAKIQSRPVESVSQSATRRDDFGSPPRESAIKVTGDDEIEKFENEFPEIEPTPVSLSLSPSCYTCNVALSVMHGWPFLSKSFLIIDF